MEDIGLLERPEAEAEGWDVPGAVADLAAIRGLMLHRLCTISHRMRTMAVREILSRHDLDLRDWIVLAALCEIGSGTQRDISRASDLDKVAVNRAAARLKQRGLVTWQPNESDGRSHLLQLSERGQATVSDCSKALTAFECKVLARFSQSESDEMSRLLERLMDSIECGP